MKELINETNINSEILLRSVIEYMKSDYRLESNTEKQMKLKVCIEKLEIVLERLVSKDNTSEKDSKIKTKEKHCGNCLLYVRDHNKKGHPKKCKIKRDFYPQPENNACDKWRSKGRE